MTPDKKRRIATATGFLSGVLACMDALRDATVSHKLELCGGIALMIVTLITSVKRRSPER